MAHALRLGRRGLGRTWPNPAVGAVVVKNGVILGRGFTQAGGRPHAEAKALEQAGERAAGATLYVTLEPCAHRSVRGAMPCMEAAIKAGVARVVSAMEDPNPHIAGVSHALMRSLGIKVSVGLGGDEARIDHRGHVSRITKGRPFVALKMALSAEGFIATSDRKPAALSSPDMNRRMHLMRAQHDAIMVGIGTVSSDDPSLTCRLPGMEERSPVRVIIDRHLRLASQPFKLVQTAKEVPVWVFAGLSASIDAERALTTQGVEVMRVESDAAGHLDLKAALALLGTRGITRLMVEGGAGLASALHTSDLIDECVFIQSQTELGTKGLAPFADHALPNVLSSFREAASESHGGDLMTTYRRP